MKPLIHEKQKAIELRQLGFTYSEIWKKIFVSKSTLSLWLRSVTLTKKQIQRIAEKQRLAQQKGIQFVHQQKIEKTRLIKQKAAAEIGKLSERERWLFGVALHWAEGTKEKDDRSVGVIFSNSDPRMVLIFRDWIFDFLKVGVEDLKYTLYIHEKSKNISAAIRFWSDLLEIDPHELDIVLKKHNPSPKRKNTSENYIGLINIKVYRSTDLNRKISGWIEGIILT